MASRTEVLDRVGFGFAVSLAAVVLADVAVAAPIVAHDRNISYGRALVATLPAIESPRSRQNHARAERIGDTVMQVYFDKNSNRKITKRSHPDPKDPSYTLYSISREYTVIANGNSHTEIHAASAWMHATGDSAPEVDSASVQVDECSPAPYCDTERLSEYDNRSYASIWKSSVPNWIVHSSIVGIGGATEHDFQMITGS